MQGRSDPALRFHERLAYRFRLPFMLITRIDRGVLSGSLFRQENRDKKSGTLFFIHLLLRQKVEPKGDHDQSPGGQLPRKQRTGTLTSRPALIVESPRYGWRSLRS